MGLRLSIVPSKVGRKKYRIAVQPGKRVPYEKFIRETEKTTTISASDIAGVFDAAARWIVSCALNGHTCDLGPLGGSYLGAKGMFDAHPKQITKEDFKLTVSWRLSPWIDQAIKSGQPVIEQQSVLRKQNHPAIAVVRALVGSLKWKERAWKAGSTLQVTGQHLRFDPQRSDEGVFLVPTSKKKKAIRIPLYHDVFDKNVRCQVPPELAGTGDVRLEVRRRVRPDSPAPVSGQLERTLKEV